jgi:thiol-disulfide isomerase/thioredoxin
MSAITLLALVPSAAPAQHSLQFDVETTTGISRGGKVETTTAEASFAIVNPARMRIESNALGATYLSMSKREHAVMYGSAQKTGAKAQGGMGMTLPDMTVVETNIPREEAIEIDGGKRDCWVVESRVSGMAVTLWIDKKLMIDLQSTAVAKIAGAPETEARIREVKKNLKIDAPIDTAKFAPAANPNEAPTLSLFAGAAPDTDLTGKMAPAFEVQGLDGRPYSAWSLKGKPVLLAFWHPGSLPCRMSAPILEKLYQEYKDRGLLVLGVDMSEDTATGFPVVLSGDSGMLGVYQVATYPTFVLIGRDGRVVAHEVGFSGETTLREMLEKR